MAGQKRVFAPDVPAIHVFASNERKTWMPGPGMTNGCFRRARLRLPHAGARFPHPVTSHACPCSNAIGSSAEIGEAIECDDANSSRFSAAPLRRGRCPRARNSARRCRASACCGLPRATFPLLESIDGEDFVSKKVPPRVEIQLLLGRKGGEGATRTRLGKMAKCGAPRVTEAIKGLLKDRLIHKTEKDIYYLTGTGEADLMKWLAENKAI